MEEVKLLIVEDNPADADLTREHLEESECLVELDTVVDGQQALDFLYQKEPYTEASRPDLVLLDLNLPRVSGHEVLATMKADENLRRIPVVVLTSSKSDEDIARSYDLHASAYVTKPVDLRGFGEVIRGLEDFWLSVVRYSGY